VLIIGGVLAALFVNLLIGGVLILAGAVLKMSEPKAQPANLPMFTAEDLERQRAQEARAKQRTKWLWIVVLVVVIAASVSVVMKATGYEFYWPF